MISDEIFPFLVILLRYVTVRIFYLTACKEVYDIRYDLLAYSEVSPFSSIILKSRFVKAGGSYRIGRSSGEQLISPELAFEGP